MAPATAQSIALTLTEYSARANETDRFAHVAQGYDKLRFGLFGEVGGLLAAVKKVSRDQLKETETEVAAEEIGDALWYLFSCAATKSVTPDTLGFAALSELRRRFGECEHTGNHANFRQIDGITDVHSDGLEAQRTTLLGELALATGELVAQQQSAQLAVADLPPTETLGHLLALLALVSASFRLRIEDVARENLTKIRARWPGSNKVYSNLFDENFEAHEQLPRNLRIEFIERGGRDKGHVVQMMNGVFIGDRLTDNSNEPDDYRFHDVFHLAYVAHLGWSPVVRSLLKLKRKSRPLTDENEDGARAMIIEEGIATWIFNHAKKREFYKDIEVGKLDYGLLKQVNSMISGYEVDQCPLWQWELAVLEGFKVFRELQANRGGIVVVDMLNHSIEFEESARPK